MRALTSQVIPALVVVAIVAGYAQSFPRAAFARCRSQAVSGTELVKAEAAELNRAGLNYSTAGKYDDAVWAFSEEIKLQPSFSFAHFNLGTLYILRLRS